jgi:threonine synthase
MSKKYAQHLHDARQEKFYTLKCVSCGSEFSEKQTTTTCIKCGEAIDVKYNLNDIKRRLNFAALKSSPLSALKYLAFYPIIDFKGIVTLNEGGTPLHKAKKIGKQLGLKKLFIKVEGANPTGVFKDRGSLVELTKAKELGAKAVCCASTGNMAASVSAYAAAAGLPCYVLIPEGTPIGKLAQTLSYGARIIQVRGTYDDCVKLCAKMAAKYNFYLAGDYAFRLEGHKSIAYEIIEQNFWKSPDFVVVPMGCGTNISAIWKGFKEFYELGFIDRLPKMIGVQPELVPTIVRAWKNKKKRFIKVEKPNSIASAVGIGVPQDDIKALRALRESKGYGEVASDDEILEAQQFLASQESLFVEPSAVIPIAVLPKLLKKKIIKFDSTIVCVATGTGLKDPKSATKLLSEPASIEPMMSEIDHYLKNKIYKLKTGVIKDREKVIWQKTPTKLEIAKVVKREFNINLEKKLIGEIYQEVINFEEKGKKINKAELQSIIEDALNELSLKNKVLEVIDFQIQSTKHKKSHADVVIKYKSKQLKTSATGVGIVDAIITALRQAIKNKDGLNIQLIDYNVEVATGGVDATVKVSMVLKDKKDNKVVATATSPDIIVASVDAFEKGYNILWGKSGR